MQNDNSMPRIIGFRCFQNRLHCEDGSDIRNHSRFHETGDHIQHVIDTRRWPMPTKIAIASVLGTAKSWLAGETWECLFARIQRRVSDTGEWMFMHMCNWRQNLLDNHHWQSSFPHLSTNLRPVLHNGFLPNIHIPWFCQDNTPSRICLWI